MIEYKSPFGDYLTPEKEPEEKVELDVPVEAKVSSLGGEERPGYALPHSPVEDKIKYLKKIKAVPLPAEYYNEWISLYTKGKQRDNLHYENINFVSSVNKSILGKKSKAYWDQRYWYVNGDSFDPAEVPYLIGEAAIEIFVSESSNYDIEEVFPDDIDNTPGLTKYGHNNVYTFGYYSDDNKFHKFAETTNPNPTIFKDTADSLRD